MITNVMERLIDFTRTSGGGYFGPDGLFRFTPASRNLLLYTQEFDNADWTKTAATVTANSTAAPDGTLTADALVEDTATNVHAAQQIVTLAAQAHTLSFYLKAVGRTWAQVLNGTIANGFAYFDLANGVVGTVGAGVTATSITSVGSGWYRCSISFTAASGGNVLSVRAAPANGTASYAGGGATAIYLWGAQLELGSTATSYARNFGGLFPPRFDYDPVTLAPRGLLVEEQRTNLLLRSEEFESASWGKLAATVTANATVSPDGTANADKLVEDATNNVHHVAQTPTLADNTNYAVTVYAKAGERNWLRIGANDKSAAVAFAWFDLATGTLGTAPAGSSITPVGNGWYRCYVPFNSGVGGSATTVRFAIATANNSPSPYTGDGTSGIYLWGAQVEAGAFATSYIPTQASQVTRTADVAVITGANFSRWYNQTSGTFLVEWRQGGSEAVQIAASVNDGTANNIMSVLNDNSSAAGVTPGAAVTNGGVAQANLTGAAITADSTNKTALAYALNDFAYSQNGAAALTDTSGTIPTVGRLDIGNRVSALFTNGHIRRIKYYPARLSNAQIQALTA